MTYDDVLSMILAATFLLFAVAMLMLVLNDIASRPALLLRISVCILIGVVLTAGYDHLPGFISSHMKDPPSEFTPPLVTLPVGDCHIPCKAKAVAGGVLWTCQEMRPFSNGCGGPVPRE